MQSTILFVGGGSLGHVLPSLAVWEELRLLGPSERAVFVTADKQEEIDAVVSAGVAVRPLHAPKFPRSLSLRSLLFPFEFLVAMVQSWRILSSVRPSLVFSKGGFISVPICFTAMMRQIPIVLHTSDSVPNLSDRIVGRWAKKICTGFPVDTLPLSLRTQAEQTGNPVREIFREASRSMGIGITGFSGRRPVVMVTGGSQGAKSINDEIDRIFDQLINVADVIHLTGTGKAIPRTHARYFSRPLVRHELPHLLALADIVITRAGASALAEIASLAKPAIVIPLSGVAHDHQVMNALFLQKQAAIDLLPQSELSSLLIHIRRLLDDTERREALGKNLQNIFTSSASNTIAKIILDVLHSR